MASKRPIRTVRRVLQVDEEPSQLQSQSQSQSQDFGEPLEKRARPSDNCYYDWDNEELRSYLEDGGINEETLNKIELELDGKSLQSLDDRTLQDLGVEDEKSRQAVLEKVSEVIRPPPAPETDNYKVFNDPIHGHIEMHPLLVAIIDTPEFQRLRWIKQLGIAYLVYPGASHNRFEHSLGVAHLAGEFARSLKNKQPNLGITPLDILCVEMAGLCHDLGHGPFSHIFDNQFIPRVSPQTTEWKHENASLAMFDHLVEQNQLSGKLTEYGVRERDVIFVKEMIKGPLKDGKYHGRPKEKHFLYEIVANKKTAIDVDKWDYLARDCHHLGIKSTFDHRRYIYFARVITHRSKNGKESTPRICCRDKEARTLYQMFQSRANLHMMAYQHKTNKNLENMLLIALEKANEYLRIQGKGGAMLKISECIHDMEAYARLTDNIFMDILNSSDPKLKDAQKTLRDMQRRKFFKFIAETMPMKGPESENQDSERHEVKDCRVQVAEECENLESEMNTVESEKRTDWKEELIVQRVAFDFGMGGKNPIDEMLFYKKHDPHTGFHMKKHEVSMMLPQIFNESRLRIYCKSRDPDVHSIAGQGFTRWCEKNNYVTPKLMGEFTPCKMQSSQIQPTPVKQENLAMTS